MEVMQTGSEAVGEVLLAYRALHYQAGESRLIEPAIEILYPLQIVCLEELKYLQHARPRILHAVHQCLLGIVNSRGLLRLPAWLFY